MRGFLAVVAGLGAIAAFSGCGSSSPPVHSSSTTGVPSSSSTTGVPSSSSTTSVPAAPTGPPAAGGVSVLSVERALLAHGGPPRPTAAVCRPSTPAERAAAPFGPTRLPLFTCDLTVTGERATYVVQVLPNGCFVAERRRPGRAVYGCGARPS